MKKNYDTDMINLDEENFEENYTDENYEGDEYYEDGTYEDEYYEEPYEEEYYEDDYYEPQRKKRSAFWPAYVIIFSLMILGWLFIIIYCKKCLVKYEAAQPENVIASIAEELSNGEIQGLDFANGSRFESADILKDTYFASLQGQEITYEQGTGSTGTLPVFDLYANGKAIATVTLESTSQENMMLLLTANTWAIKNVSPKYETGDTGVTVRVPSNYTVLVNGVEADNRELVDDSMEFEDFVNVKPYADVPTMAEYRIDGLMFTPEIKVVDENGREAEVVADASTYTAGFVTEEMPADLQALVLKYAEDYTNFFSGDLPGCAQSINCLRPMFTSNSYFFAPAEIYRCEDMSFYSAHLTPTFANEVVSNYSPVNADFFYVDISFEKTLHLTRTGEDHIDYTNQRYYYVKENGNWVIADMKQNIE